ncbi:MAG: hypothetical protein JWM87_3543 [Candidatus Eremiobacteraeota bacterium]|nr:hypothetical protein [Candidatus Eremiobacteraeota bacterium]
MNAKGIDAPRHLNRRWVLALLGAGTFTSSVALATRASALIWYAGRVDGTRYVESDADEIVPAASVIKLLIAMALVDEAHRGHFRLTTQVALVANDRVGGSDRFRAVAPGSYPAGALLDAMLSLSDNTASNALLRAVGMRRCNEVAAEHGLPRRGFAGVSMIGMHNAVDSKMRPRRAKPPACYCISLAKRRKRDPVPTSRGGR